MSLGQIHLRVPVYEVIGSGYSRRLLFQDRSATCKALVMGL